MFNVRCSVALCAALATLAFCASSSPSAAAPLPVPEPIGGALVLHGGGPLTTETLAAFIRRAGGESAKLVVIPTAAADPALADAAIWWMRKGIREVKVVHTRDRERADSAKFVAPLEAATAVWISGGLQQRLERAYIGTATERALLDLLDRGGVIGGSSAGAAFLSRTMIRRGNPEPQIGSGLDALPHAIIDQHFSERDRSSRLRSAVDAHPRRVGYGIDEGTALHVDRRYLKVTGVGSVHVLLPAGAGRPASRFRIAAGGDGDHVALARIAIQRSGEPFPPESFAERRLEGGTLVAVGGGAVPRRAFEAFQRAAGGPRARIAVITTAQDRQQRAVATDASLFGRLGASNVRNLHAASRSEADSPEFAARIDAAGGVWFSGGRSWRLADRYLGTASEAALRRLIERGGAIGGTSAGASFLADYLVRGDPLQTREPMAESYCRGLAALPGIAIDQHVRERGRLPDLLAVKRRYPQLLVIGLDESTAVIIRDSTLQVAGIGEVRLANTVDDGGEPFTVLRSGDGFDLRSPPGD